MPHWEMNGNNRETVFFYDDDINEIWEVSLYFHRVVERCNL